MHLKQIILIATLIISTTLLAQQKNKQTKVVKDGFQISIHTANLKNQKLQLYLISGVTKKQFVTDSLTITDNNQIVVFKQPKKIIDAIYYLKFSTQKNGVGIAVDNGIKMDLYLNSNTIEEITCSNNAINKDFIEYQQLDKSATPEQKTNSRNVLLSRYPNSILQLYLAAENKIAEKVPATLEEKINYRNFYFTFLDRTDKRILFLPNTTKLLYKYVTLLPITAENYIDNIDNLLKGLDCKSKNYDVFSNYFISNLAFFETNQLEKAFNHLYKNYIDKNPCDIFSAADYNSYSNKYATNIKVPIGTKCPDFELVSKDTIAYKLSEVFPKNDFTFIAFYSPSCIHCQEKMPVVSASFQNLKNRYPAKKIQLIAVINDADESDWTQFISEKKLDSWLNLKSQDSKRKYQEDFNAYSNPSYFLINKSGDVILKTFNIKAIEELINK
ncbi:TlpA family protein disulfide reductase [Flavobacterium sp.]|jgi:thiol-disulfide isomerase/thioredoxin|uniref:TlpA family protein disulfide reductase n=1 Tax=Flavobacterium sp. TaxID=239 RepID=UPI0037C00137